MRTGYFYIAVTTVLFSSMEIALKTIASRFNPIQLNLYRFFFGALLLLPFAFAKMKKKGTRFLPGDAGFFALTGFVGIIVSMTLYQLSIVWSKASIVAVVFSCNPVFVLPFARVLLGERIRRYNVVTMIVSLAGMFCIVSQFLGEGAGSPAGVFSAVLAGAAFALYGVLGKFRAARFGGIAVTCFGFLAGAAELLVLILLSRLPAAVSLMKAAGLGLFAEIPFLQGVDLQTLPILAYVCLGVTGIGFASYFLAIETASASIAAVVFYIKPALAPVLALLILGETITAPTLAGIALIVAGSAVTFAGSLKPSEAAEARARF